MKQTKKMLDIEEKRRYLRFNVHYMAIVYMRDDFFPATVVDICEGGIGIITPLKLNFHDEFYFKVNFNIEEARKSHVHFKAKVLWMEEANIKQMYLVGLEITEIAHKDYEVLRKLLDELYVRDSIQSKFEKHKSII